MPVGRWGAQRARREAGEAPALRCAAPSHPLLSRCTVRRAPPALPLLLDVGLLLVLRLKRAAMQHAKGAERSGLPMNLLTPAPPLSPPSPRSLLGPHFQNRARISDPMMQELMELPGTTGAPPLRVIGVI